ncbi:MAG TPA: hypothetical protein VGK97_11500, partial [Spongiibacteraceae bacterium]
MTPPADAGSPAQRSDDVTAALSARFIRAVASTALAAVPTVAALLTALLMFALFLEANGTSAAEALPLIIKGAFGSSFAFANTLQRAAPLMLTALCVALPARAGLVIIGGEGALALGALAAGVVPALLPQLAPALGVIVMGSAGMIAGGLWIGAAGALRQRRGVNETISSLLLSYIG